MLDSIPGRLNRATPLRLVGDREAGSVRIFLTLLPFDPVLPHPSKQNPSPSGPGVAEAPRGRSGGLLRVVLLVVGAALCRPHRLPAARLPDFPVLHVPVHGVLAGHLRQREGRRVHIDRDGRPSRGVSWCPCPGRVAEFCPVGRSSSGRPAISIRKGARMQFTALPGRQAAARCDRGKEHQGFAQLTNQFTQFDIPWDGQWERKLSIREDRFPDGADSTSCSTGNLARKVRRLGIPLPNSESFCPKNNCGKASAITRIES